MGWSLLPFLDEEETAYEERDSSKIIKSKDVVLAEKAFMSYHLWTKARPPPSGVLDLVVVLLPNVVLEGRGEASLRSTV